MQPALYAGLVIEYERGWGARPDGWLVATTKEAFEEKAASIRNCGDYECFYRVDSTPHVKFVTQEFYEKVHGAENNALWTSEAVTRWEVAV